MRFSMIVFVLGLFACGDDDGMADGGTDTGADVPAIDAPAEDVPAIDAPVVDAPVGPAHCGDSLVIAEYDPMTSITIFNPTADAVDVGETGWVLCQRANYFVLNSIEEGAVIPAGGSHTFDLPAAFQDQDDDGGEVVLYEASAFASTDAIRDYVCWGTGRAESRRTVAEGAGIWSGDCAPAITGEALRRIPDTDGTGAASYDATGAAEALSCP